MFAAGQCVVALAVKFWVDGLFAISEHAAMSISPTELQTKAGISKGYASNLLSGKKQPSQPMALKIFRETGLKLGVIAGLSAEEIAVLEKVHG